MHRYVVGTGAVLINQYLQVQYLVSLKKTFTFRLFLKHEISSFFPFLEWRTILTLPESRSETQLYIVTVTKERQKNLLEKAGSRNQIRIRRAKTTNKSRKNLKILCFEVMDVLF
jgi:hypothetical protein